MGGIWDRAAAVYERSGVEFFAPMGRELVRRAGLRPGERVLDLGTGRGHVLFPAAEAVGPGGSVLGIDLAAEMVRLTAADIAVRDVVNAEVRVGAAAAPGPAPGSVDVVLGGFMMFMLPDPAAAVREFRELLATPGRLVFSTYGPRNDDLERARVVLRSVAGTTRPEDDVFDDPEAAVALLRSAGFDEVTTDEVMVPVRFADLDQWWAWAWSVGIRRSLELIGPEGIERARPEVEAALAGAVQPDGSLVLPTVVRFTVART